MSTCAEEIVTRGCAHICLPKPTRVRVMRRSMFPGTPSAPEFVPFPRKAERSGSDKFTRLWLHAELEFAKPVEGPVLLGAGRYFGVGLCGSSGTRRAKTSACSAGSSSSTRPRSRAEESGESVDELV